MQIILDNMCEKLHGDRLRNNRSLGDRKSEVNNNNNFKNKKNLKTRSGLNSNIQCKTTDAVSGSEFNAHTMTVTQ